MIELLACGGVTPQNLSAYFKNGANAFAVGSSIFRREWLTAGKFSAIQKKIEAYVNVLRSVGKGKI